MGGSMKLRDYQKTAVEAEVVCADFDEDCEGVKDKVKCWLHQPECGLCPFLKQPKDGECN